MITEKDASALWCHRRPGEVRCLASECMAWRFVQSPPPPDQLRPIQVIIPHATNHDEARFARRPAGVPGHWDVVSLGNRMVWQETDSDLAKRRKKVPATTVGFCIDLERRT